MSKISEFDSAILVKISPELLRWFTRNIPKKGMSKLSFSVNNGIYYYDKKELLEFDKCLHLPWPKSPKGKRPHIPTGIENEIKKEAFHRCPACNTNIGEVAHIEAVSTSLNNHPHNLIYLCPNHHTVYDNGYKYNNLTIEEVKNYKKGLLIFQNSIWTLRSSLINSYLAVINQVNRIEALEKTILKSIKDSEFEEFFKSVVDKIETLNKTNKQKAVEKATAKKKLPKDYSKFESNRELANYLLENNSKKSIGAPISGLVDCPLCGGKGWTDDYELCPPCHGAGVLSKEQINNIDFALYEFEDCPLCDGKGCTDDFEICPPCHGSGKLSRDQINNIDFDIYELEDCIICQGKGNTEYYEVCPPCHGTGWLTKEEIKNIDFDIYKIEDCPLCNGKGETDDFETCPPCNGVGRLSKQQINNIDFNIYEFEDCPLCNGKGYTNDYDTCPPCQGEGKLTKEQINYIDFRIYELEDCPLCNGKGSTDEYDECPPCQGEGRLSREQINNIDFRMYEIEDCPLCEGKGWNNDYDICPACREQGRLSREEINNIDFHKY